MTVLRVGYKSGVRFDHDYYMTKHLPLTGAVMGPYGVKSVEVMRVTAAPDGSAAAYQVIFSAYFESAAALQNASPSITTRHPTSGSERLCRCHRRRSRDKRRSM
jgi:uncharacterized protein (TIGR02118 family)